jgi:repressor LexA
MNLTKRQKEILDFIRNYRQSNGISPTQREIRESFNLHELQHPPGQPRQGQHGQRARRAHRGRAVRRRRRGPTALGVPPWARYAGRPIEPFPNEESIEVPASMLAKASTSCWCVRGESMIDDGILDGDYVVVARREKAESGQTVVALIRGEATLKRYYAEGARVRLQPANAAMKPFTVDARDVTIQGVVTGLIRDYSRALR